MRFSNFLFPESRDPARDGVVIEETLPEVTSRRKTGLNGTVTRGCQTPSA